MQTTRPTIQFERTFQTSIERLWALWTTKPGIESWWGPVGFKTEVTKLDLHAGGEFSYIMTAVGEDQIRFMKQAGMPTSHGASSTLTELEASHHLAWKNRIDFIPGVQPYDAQSSVDFETAGDAVRMVVTLETLHDDQWTKQAAAGWESQLGRLSGVIAAGVSAA